MFIDPDGRKAMAPNTWEWTQPTNGALGYMLGGGSATFGSFEQFLGQGNPFGGLGNPNSSSGGGGIGGIKVTDQASIIFFQGYFGSGGSVDGIFSMLDQLIEAGWKDPLNTKANFNDWKQIITTGAISELISVLNSAAGSDNVTPDFRETNSFLYKGKSEGFRILISMRNISSVLEYAFIIGHEVTHSITNYFRDDFYKTIKSTPNNTTSRDAFSFFHEYNSYNWEMKMGNSNIRNAFDTTYSKHGPACNAGGIFFGYPQPAIDVVQSNLNNLNTAWSIFYNNLK